jgi:hypothetical protein
MYLLAVDAESLLDWADVPNAKADYMAGYQRVYNPERAAAIREFLASDPNNIIPGAIIVTVAVDAIEVQQIDNGVVRLAVKTKARTFEEQVKSLYDHFSSRLSSEELKSIDDEVELWLISADYNQSDNSRLRTISIPCRSRA